MGQSRRGTVPIVKIEMNIPSGQLNNERFLIRSSENMTLVAKNSAEIKYYANAIRAFIVFEMHVTPSQDSFLNIYGDTMHLGRFSAYARQREPELPRH